MWIVIGVIVLVLILFVLSGSFSKKQQEDQIRLELTAEHQRLQREDPNHPDAQLGIEELILSRKNEVRGIQQQNMRTILKYGAIGGLGVGTVLFIWGQMISYDGFPMAMILGISTFGMALGGLAGAVVSLKKRGRPKLRVKAE
jgi:hypothetical protein